MKKLLILAGMPGSGKTYFLNKAFEYDIRLFGEEYHEDFRNFMQQGLLQGDPKNEDGMNRLNFTSLGSFHNNEYQDAFVYHVDLLGFYLKRIFDKRGKILPVVPDDVRMLENKKLRQKLVSDLFVDRLDAKNSIVAVNNLDNGFKINREQFFSRKLKRRQTKLKLLWPLWSLIYKPTPFLTDDIDYSRKIYDLIKRAWLEDIEFLGFKTVYNTKVVEGEYQVQLISKGQ